MFKKTLPFFIKVITPLHAGSGQDLGIVDLPIQRERHTSFPKIEASGLKGSIREVFDGLKDDKEKMKELKKKYPDIELTKLEQAISLLFGPENTDNAHAGALGFTDARILLFPVKSAKGVFAWITCPKVLERFRQDMALAKENADYKIPDKLEDGECLVSENSILVVNNAVILEEYAFQVSDQKIAKDLASELVKRTKIDPCQLLVLSDNDFTDFVNLSTEVITRTRIDNETGTVESGALFTEEYLPSETVLYSIALASPIFSRDKGIFRRDGRSEEELVLEFWNDNMPDVMQIGGNATIGKGLVEIIKGGSNEDSK